MKPHEIDLAIDQCADRIANRWFGDSGIPNMVAALQELALEEIQGLLFDLEEHKYVDSSRDGGGNC